MNNLTKEIILQEIEHEGKKNQFRITIPFDIVSVAGWKKGTKINATFIFGSGQLIMEAAENATK